MGGDNAPGVVVDGALEAVRRLNVNLILVGSADVLEGRLREQSHSSRLSIVDAPDVIEMHESPLAALRRKRNSSIRVAADLVAAGAADALLSAGHSGATFLAAHAAFGTLPGVDRPALVVTVPTRIGATVLLDVGASAECRPEHLIAFGRMGSAFARATLGIERPRVGLLSIGEEVGKGNDLVREAYSGLEKTSLPFVGNVEARDLFTGRADVVVCDGYTGNIALKVGEGLVEAIEDMIREELGGALVSQIGGLLTRGAMARFKQRVDHAERGAAVLVGVAGLTLIGHGRSSPRAVSNAIAMAHRLVTTRFMENLKTALTTDDFQIAT